MTYRLVYNDLFSKNNGKLSQALPIGAGTTVAKRSGGDESLSDRQRSRQHPYPSLAFGYSWLAAWSDLIDRINVFPVADADTGANLRVSLAVLMDYPDYSPHLPERLALQATGNSGNIAAAFFGAFVQARDLAGLRKWAVRGRDRAWEAVARPRPGTMLSVFASLVEVLNQRLPVAAFYENLVRQLQQQVMSSREELEEIRHAGVVDAGALAMFIFFDGFFHHYTGQPGQPQPVHHLFAGSLEIDPDFQPVGGKQYCVNVRLAGPAVSSGVEAIETLGESVVTLHAPDGLKLHVHTSDPEDLRGRLAALGKIQDWQRHTIDAEEEEEQSRSAEQCLHIVTDAAGSLPRKLARRHGITLLDSYILVNDRRMPESCCTPQHLYSLLRAGQRLTTAQASVLERRLAYGRIMAQYGRTLYLCVGSAFTGNFEVARAWQRDHDPDGLFTVLDTGAASGRLALIALEGARIAAETGTVRKAFARIKGLIARVQEYLFIEDVCYLAASGRVSRFAGFLGHGLGMRPVLRLDSRGLHRVALVRSQEAQLDFFRKRLREDFPEARCVFLLQYSDNREWLTSFVEPLIREVFPGCVMEMVPLSLTSGVHMGPGTWGVAWTLAAERQWEGEL